MKEVSREELQVHMDRLSFIENKRLYQAVRATVNLVLHGYSLKVSIDKAVRYSYPKKVRIYKTHVDKYVRMAFDKDYFKTRSKEAFMKTDAGKGFVKRKMEENRLDQRFRHSVESG